MTVLLHNMYGRPPITISYRGQKGKKNGGTDTYHLRDSSAGRWVGISLPNLSLLHSHDHGAGGNGTSGAAGAAPTPEYFQWILDQFSIPRDTNSGKELTRRIRKKARELPIPGACLVKRLESPHDFLPDNGRKPKPPRAPDGPALAPMPLHSWEDDLATQLAVITQSSRHVWLRSKMPILSRIHSDYAHMAILLPRDFSDPHIREIPPRRLREVAREND